MIEIGRYNELRILRQTSVGLYLGDESGEDVLLPNKYCPESFNLEDNIEVFVYRDYAGRKVATNLTPKIFLNEFALLQVTAVADVGAFMDWGMEKDLMVPFKEQRQKMEEGRWYIVYLDIDKKTDRLYASNKIEKFLQNEVLTLEEGEEVELLVLQKTDIGFSVIVNNAHKGLIFKNEIFKELNIGDKLNGFVKKIREDNKIDISIQPIGYDNFNDTNSELIYRTLVKNKGFLAVTDKSSPDEIYLQFGISKKAFKKSIGALYKQRKITIQLKGIKLI
ncbi:MAG: GntR family transcriptional regulator [Bacteroidales bacterium]|nr:GntR family transcriptional regulator [Bacteroidales bacterium]